MNESKPKLDIVSPPEPGRDMNAKLIIAGPCSAETEEQVLQIAVELAKIPQVSIFRAGVWKPRTRPNTFEGVGVEGLKWLQLVKSETGLLTTVEVANASHTDAALKFGVDVLWVGARTSANPFSVQEIADALRGTDVPVWVKNPVNPDLQLWIGALERLNHAGIKRLGAIHRGFTTHEKTPFRNPPKWEMAIELRRLIPNVPLLCDPSHIAGKRELLQVVSQKALDLAMDGLMIETHTDPNRALSDAKQQITPIALKALLGQLKVRKAAATPSPQDDLLAKLRQQSNAIDYELLEVLSRRMAVVRQIGQFKKEHNMTILQVERWQKVLEDRMEKGDKLGLDQSFIKAVYEVLHEYAIKLQSKVMNPNSN